MAEPLDPTPEALLARLLEPLAAGDVERAAAKLHAAATPRFRSRVGSPADLARHLRNPLNAPLLGHAEAVPGEPERIADAARQRVAVVTPEGERAAYLLSSKRDEDGNWRVSGLVREEVALG